MAKIMIPDYAYDFLPKNVDPSQLSVHYNPRADSLTVYFTGKPVPSVWNDIDPYAYIGFALEDETKKPLNSEPVMKTSEKNPTTKKTDRSELREMAELLDRFFAGIRI